MFYLTRQEVRDALFDYGNAWAVGTDPTAPITGRRRSRPQETMTALATQGAAAGAVNRPP